MSHLVGTLTVMHAQGSQRYALLGRPLSGGDVVQLCCSGGWLTGRFERDADGPPRFHFSIELEGGGVQPHAIDVPDGALLRWPA